MQWCGFHAARSESERCILLWCLAARTVAARHLSSCWRRLLSSASRVRKSMSCCDTRLLTLHQTWPPNRPDLSSVDYRLLRVIQECVCQKQQGVSNIVDELWLLTEWYFITEWHTIHYIIHCIIHCVQKKHSLLFSCITLRKSNQFGWKLKTK